MIAFGPVPSRRLGRSLGVNNIPPKICSYSCIYCQLGRTSQVRIDRRSFYRPAEILRAVREQVEAARCLEEPIDYLTFVPDGEPTLDVHLGQAIDLLKSLDIKIAVITNASLIWRRKVREALMKADWVSLKVDAVSEKIWRCINRPHGSLRLCSILDGMGTFATSFSGELATETMLIDGLNDGEHYIRELAQFLQQLRPSIAYLAIPTRPPAEKYARPPHESQINRAYQLFSEQIERVELLVGYEGNAFAFTGHAEQDLLSITSVHPMRAEAVAELLAKAGETWDMVRRMIAEGKLIEMEHEGHTFYMRKLASLSD
ncbi:MAG: radical SAM protein [Chloroflexi bacterium]|nr:radical SAM protein [Chloroflexota bacterium]